MYILGPEIQHPPAHPGSQFQIDRLDTLKISVSLIAHNQQIIIAQLPCEIDRQIPYIKVIGSRV